MLQLQILAAIQEEIGDTIPIQYFFDLIVGTK